MPWQHCVTNNYQAAARLCFAAPPGGHSHMEWMGMLIVSLRGVNFGFWSHLECSGQNVIIFSRQGLGKGCTRRTNKTERILILYIYSFRGPHKLRPRPDWSLLGVKFKISGEHPRPFQVGVPPPEFSDTLSEVKCKASKVCPRIS